MKRVITFILTIILLVLGALIVFANPWDPTAIIVGMLLVSVSILNLAIQIYFPPLPEQPVELKVVEEPIPEKIPVKVVKSKKSVKVRKRK